MTKKQLEQELIRCNETLVKYRLANLKLIKDLAIPHYGLTDDDFFYDLALSASINEKINFSQSIYYESVPIGKIKKIIFEGTLVQLMKIFELLKCEYDMVRNLDQEAVLEHFYVKEVHLEDNDIYTPEKTQKIKCYNKTSLAVFIKFLSEADVQQEQYSGKKYLYLGRNIFSSTIEHFCNSDGKDYSEKHNLEKLASGARTSNKQEELIKELEKILHS